MSEDYHLGTMCPECGFDVAVDEDGLCVMCGATAVGPAVDQVIRLRDAIFSRIDAYNPGPMRDALESIVAELKIERKR